MVVLPFERPPRILMSVSSTVVVSSSIAVLFVLPLVQNSISSVRKIRPASGLVPLNVNEDMAESVDDKSFLPAGGGGGDVVVYFCHFQAFSCEISPSLSLTIEVLVPLSSKCL